MKAQFIMFRQESRGGGEGSIKATIDMTRLRPSGLVGQSHFVRWLVCWLVSSFTGSLTLSFVLTLFSSLVGRLVNLLHSWWVGYLKSRSFAPWLVGSSCIRSMVCFFLLSFVDSLVGWFIFSLVP